MEKSKIFILKNPLISAIATFVFAFAIAIVLKLGLGFADVSLDKIIIPLAIIFPALYSYQFKEQAPKSYRGIYAFCVTFLYALLNTLVVIYSPKYSQSKYLQVFINAILIESIGIFLGIYFISGRIGNYFLKYDLKKLAIKQKELSIEVKKKRRKKIALFFFIILLSTIPMHLLDMNVIPSNKNIEILLPLLPIFAIYFGFQYIKKDLDIEKSEQ